MLGWWWSGGCPRGYWSESHPPPRSLRTAPTSDSRQSSSCVQATTHRTLFITIFTRNVVQKTRSTSWVGSNMHRSRRPGHDPFGGSSTSTGTTVIYRPHTIVWYANRPIYKNRGVSTTMARTLSTVSLSSNSSIEVAYETATSLISRMAAG